MTDEKPKIKIEIEDDAEELFKNALENFDPSQKGNFKEEFEGKTKRVIEMYDLDLHGLDLPSAKERVKSFFSSEKSKFTRCVCIITGKGRHSDSQGGTLVREIYPFVKENFSSRIKKMEHNPAEDMIEGLPLRGHFKVWLKS